MAAARAAGVDPAGADVYMFGHWWCCEPCWQSMIEAGVRDVYVTEDAHERFSRDAVYGETLQPKVKTLSLEGFDESWAELIRDAAAEVGVETVDQGGDLRVVKKRKSIDCFAAGEDEPVYTIDEMDPCVAARQVRNVLKQV